MQLIKFVTLNPSYLQKYQRWINLDAAIGFEIFCRCKSIGYRFLRETWSLRYEDFGSEPSSHIIAFKFSAIFTDFHLGDFVLGRLCTWATWIYLGDFALEDLGDFVFGSFN